MSSPENPSGDVVWVRVLQAMGLASLTGGSDECAWYFWNFTVDSSGEHGAEKYLCVLDELHTSFDAAPNPNLIQSACLLMLCSGSGADDHHDQVAGVLGGAVPCALVAAAVRGQVGRLRRATQLQHLGVPDGEQRTRKA